ncbi:MAG: DUF262 domain-containing protein [Acidobacteriota bacterium]|nr:DUF262 domain-containing protein [Acidobacteriota bacterium]
MNAGEVIFQKLLDGKIQYRIPLFQRTYNWREEQWKQLWQDLMRIYSMDTRRKHFVGSIVTYPIHGLPGDVNQHVMIDGQQRITTLLILLGVIRDHAHQAPEKWPGLPDEIRSTCLINEFAEDPEERIKLMPSRRDREPFDDLISNSRILDGTKQVAKAWQYFDRKLRRGDNNGNSIDLKKLKICVTDRLDIVSIALDSSDNPNRIFESLNYTGMPLTASDLIRNYLFMNIRDVNRQDSAYDKYWYPMQERLGRYLDDFFWRYLMMDGSLPRNNSKDIFDGVRDLIGQQPTEDQTVNALRQFNVFSRYYAQLAEVDTSGLTTATVERIHRLNQWQVDVAYPFLMKSLDHIGSSIKEHDVLEVMRMIESFVVRRAACSIPTNSLRRYFSQMAAGVDFKNFIASSKEYLSKKGWIWPSDDRFREGFLQFQVYNRTRLSRANLILWSLERAFEHKETPARTDKIEIEHIMPQTLTAEWIEALGPKFIDIHDRWLHTIGNLTLSAYNAELSNMMFAEKREILIASNFSLNSSLISLRKWDEEMIEERGRVFSEMAVIIWPR